VYYSVEIKIFNRLVKVFIVECNISFKFINHSFPDICLYDFFLFENLALEVCSDILDTSCILHKSYKQLFSITTDIILLITALFLILEQYNRVFLLVVLFISHQTVGIQQSII